MKTPKPKLFTEEFVRLMMLVLSLVIGAITLLVYKDRLPLWMILALGFWYPSFCAIRALWTSSKGDQL